MKKTSDMWIDNLTQVIKSTNHKKLNKMKFTKLKIICSSHETYENEGQATDWESIFVIHISEKKFVSRIYFLRSPL